MKRTFLGHLREKAKGAVENRYANPAKAKIGDVFGFESVGYSGKVFTVEGMRQVDREIMGDTFTFTTYDFDMGVRLQYSGDNILLLELAEEFEYNKELHHDILNATGKDPGYDGEIEFEGKQYFRVNDVLTSYEATATLVSDKDGDGKVDIEEVSESKIEYWDFWRKEDSGRLYFLFYEMEADTGYFRVWEGFETHKNLIQGGS